MDSEGRDSSALGVPDGSLNDRAARIFEFLVELQRLRTRVVRSLASYRTVLWFGELPSAGGLQSAPGLAEPGVWLAVDRVERVAPPTPPDLLRPWITERSLRDSSQTMPSLSERSVRAVQVVSAEGIVENATEEMLLTDHPEVEAALDEWATIWQAWAADDRPRAAVGEVYHRLYSMYQESRALAETYEVVVGFGCLVTSSGGQDVRRHLVTVAATIELDLDSGRLTVLPSPDAGPPSLEQDMLDPEDTASDDIRQVIRSGLQNLDDPWAAEPDGVGGLLRTWVNGSGPKATYLPDLAPPDGRATSGMPATVTFAPALMLRERTRRSFVAACEQIIAALRAGAEVPAGVRQFAEITDGRVFDSDQRSWEEAYTDAEVYFPKPANEEQRQIRDRLADHQTVVVQGPPGTGKTHTIANLISDLLAHGQRVLVTSTTTRALTVLKSKLPGEIADLCVSVTDDAVKGQADLERSVSTILDQADTWNPRAAEHEAADIRGVLDDARRRQHQALAELRSIREQETYEYAPDVGDYSGTLQDIAGRLAEEEPRFGWIGPVPDGPPRLSVADADRYLSLLRRATPELVALIGTVPDLSRIVRPVVFEELAERRTELLDRGRELADVRGTEEFQALAEIDPAEREQLGLGLANLNRRRRELERRHEPWVSQALRDVASGRGRTWRHRHEMTTAGIRDTQAWLKEVDGHVITGLDGFELGEAVGHANALLDHLSAGGKLKGVLGRTRVAKAATPFLERVRVDGRACEALDHIRAAHGHVMIEKVLAPLERTWGYGGERDLPQAQRVATLADDAEVLEEVLTFGDAASAIERRLESVAAMPAVDLNSVDDLRRVTRAVDAAALAAHQQDVQVMVDPALRLLADLGSKPGAVPPVRRAATALKEWDPVAYQAAFQALEEAQEANELVGQLSSSREHVAAVLPELAERIEATEAEPIWDQRLPNLPQAWAWSVWDERLRAKTDPQAERRWRDSLAAAEVDARAALQRLATNRGWAHALRRLTATEAAHLKMYAQAVRKAGKGTGKYASRYRDDARNSLRECQTAVPAWIMPMHQVFDTVPVDRPNLFDVVIVDEASQSGLEGLLLSWLAPRMVVVGDDKQVSPSNVGLDHEAVFTLQDRYLGPLAHKSLFGPLSSFFDQAVGMSASRIMLREHFRCMPEIIGFSNELCYRGALVPLRQYGADRLSPLRTTYVRGAVVSGRRDVVNEPEAEAIVSQIEKCCADPAYDGKTIGVITLLGHTQDKLITERLVDALGVRVVEERQLRAGNAEAFQGDERDVIFISLVSSLQSTIGPARIGPLSKESDQQRLNVAASRARDQVWLFHSVQPGDLSAKDLRQRYLQYLLKPPAAQDGLDIGEVRADQRHPAFDSLFEQRVFLALRERGYRVRPQLKVGGYRIDLVVEGGTRRLAVECDGDAFHGGDAQFDDAARQRDLERVGWRFWRVRGSAFFRDSQQALEPLWELLRELDIQPVWDDQGGNESAESHSEVEASAVPATDSAADLVDDLRPGTEPIPLLSSSATLVAPQHEPGVPEPPRVGRPVERFRDGRLLLTPVAHRRVQEEERAIREWLAEPPPIRAVDARSHDVQRANQESLRDDLETRLGYLRRVLAQSLVDPQHVAGQWVTPGCIVGLRYPGEDQIERLVVTSMPHAGSLPADVSPVSPFTALAHAIDGAEPGATVRFETPRGIQHATVVEVSD